MKVRGKKTAPAQKGPEPTPKPIAQQYRVPAPIRGWVLNENRALAQPGGARILDNWVPTTTGARVRGGSRKHATVHATEACECMFSYISGSSRKLFAATASVIVDITTVADPLVPPSPTISGRTGGYYSTEQFGTAGGDYLYAVNGIDPPLLFDGVTFTPITAVSTPAITGVPTTEMSHVWSFANRLFFVRKGTMEAYYLPVDSIGGAASTFSLAGIFKLGGALLFGAKWSLDAGDGLDDKCVFVSTEGEVAVYEGTNPGSASEWRKAGVYQITRPLGQNATVSAGGDLLIATEVGIVPLSEAVRRDVAALELGAVSRNISPYWQVQAQKITTLPWEIIKSQKTNIMIVSQPNAVDPVGSCLVANLQTGAWSRFVGWRTRCLGMLDGEGFFGSEDGCVYSMEQGGSDDGNIYSCTYLGHFDDFGAAGVQKTVMQMRPIFQTGNPIQPLLSMVPDYNEALPSPPSSVADFTISLWDAGLWDVALWDGGAPDILNFRWVSVGVTGFALAPVLLMTYGVTPTPRTEIVAIDVAFHTGALVA